jgi:hypothetical protein
MLGRISHAAALSKMGGTPHDSARVAPVEKLSEPLESVSSGLALFFLGVSVAAGFSIVALFAGPEKPKTWVVAVYATATFFTLVLAGTWWFIATKSRKTRRSEVREICGEMDDIEARFGNPVSDVE